MLQNFSPIQNHILSRLKNAKSLRYSELQPLEKVPNDLFNYHLQFLVKKGFVHKLEDGYSLAELGIKHVADPLPVADQQKIVSLYKVNVITIVSRIVDGELQILNQIRTSNPSYGKIGVMGGVVLKGELLENAAKRKLKEETGLDADFKIVGMERRIMYVQDELFSDVIFPIAYATDYSGTLVDKTDFGEHIWVPIDRAIKHESDPFDSIAAITTVLKAIKNKTIDTLPYFYSEEIRRGEKRP